MTQSSPSTTTGPATDDGKPLYVYIALPRCPKCRTAAIRSYRSEANGDGTRTRWSQCKVCLTKFRVVLE